MKTYIKPITDYTEIAMQTFVCGPASFLNNKEQPEGHPQLAPMYRD